MKLVDNYRRTINYLRLSVTDRCNLRCRYCMPAQGVEATAHAQILIYEDLLFLAQTAVGLGVEKIRITGGEPLVRRGIISFLERLHALKGMQHLVLTTNGLLLEEYAQSLKDAGVRCLNVSVDSLQPQRYAHITRGGDLASWWRGIEAAHHAGLRLKLNVVVMRGINDDEIHDFTALAAQNPWSVRFIEYMPTLQGPDSTLQGIETQTLLESLRQHYTLEPVLRQAQAGPAQEFRLGGGKGSVGFIAAISCPFCHNCNRIRISATGKGRSCLFAQGEMDLKPAIKQRNHATLSAELIKLVAQKPQQHDLGEQPAVQTAVAMSAIGG